MAQQIDIYIDQIILHGFDRLNAAALKATVQEHLISLIAEKGLPDAFVNQQDISRLDGGAFQIRRPLGAKRIGTEIAQSIYHGWENSHGNHASSHASQGDLSSHKE